MGPATRDMQAHDPVNDVTALLLPALGVLCLIAHRRQSERGPGG